MIKNIGDSTKIVVLGSCSIDFTTYASRLPQAGETLIGTKFGTSYGGKGANQCVAAAKLGADIAMIARLGDDQWGWNYLENFKKHNVNISHVNLSQNEHTGIAQINVASNGENQIVIVPGANNCLSINDVKKSEALIKSAAVLVAQLETPLETTLEAFKLCNGLKLLNAAPARTDLKTILPYCTIICVNEIEASLITNINVSSIVTSKNALEMLIQMGCELAIITLGDKGAVYLSQQEGQAVHVSCDKVKGLDSTGAGDAFVGALATYLVQYKHKPIDQIIGAACEVATISVTVEGTQTSYPESHVPFKRTYQSTHI